MRRFRVSAPGAAADTADPPVALGEPEVHLTRPSDDVLVRDEVAVRVVDDPRSGAGAALRVGMRDVDRRHRRHRRAIHRFVSFVAVRSHSSRRRRVVIGDA
jgi:hypothetical protein